MQKEIIKADEVYFLGFGFDINNLYQLGVINTQNKLEYNLQNKEKRTKILISGGNARIINLIREIFEINDFCLINDVYNFKNEIYDIYISPKFLPDALINDL